MPAPENNEQVDSSKYQRAKNETSRDPDQVGQDLIEDALGKCTDAQALEKTEADPRARAVITSIVRRAIQHQKAQQEENYYDENREELSALSQSGELRARIANSRLMQETIIPALNAAYQSGTPYRYIPYYTWEDEAAPHDGFVLKADDKMKEKGFQDIDVDFDEEFGELLPAKSAVASTTANEAGAEAHEVSGTTWSEDEGRLNEAASGLVDSATPLFPEDIAELWKKVEATGRTMPEIIAGFSGTSMTPAKLTAILNQRTKLSPDDSPAELADFIQDLQDANNTMATYGDMMVDQNSYREGRIRLEILSEGVQPTDELIQTRRQKEDPTDEELDSIPELR
ncbi:hypothetical protein CO046_03150 [Candidatus Peregrinibacteria bacterium CG_4_9_14_0_2_um_filter_53_11]|nr:MAG: hypothetical protein CO046_03150 [Candidatus Peregrinibacteria bacterium CG_4_9_14_0_2_um_filter_53_11]